MLLSVVFGIKDRLELLDLGLKSLTRQTLRPQDFEVIIADCESQQDISKVYSQYPLTITHIRYSPKTHPHYRGYHTSSLGINLALKRAKGEVICHTQPEVFHDTENLARGASRASTGTQAFAQTILTHPKYTPWIKSNFTKPFDSLWEEANRLASPFPDNEMYWYCLFFPRIYVDILGGVDETYMEGVYGEDDNFKDRLKFAGCEPVMMSTIRAIHINHEYERDLYPQQDRNSAFWYEGARINRERYRNFCLMAQELKNKKELIRANKGEEWGNEKYILDIKHQNPFS